MNLYTKDEVNNYMQEAYNLGQKDMIQEGLLSNFFNDKPSTGELKGDELSRATKELYYILVKNKKYISCNNIPLTFICHSYSVVCGESEHGIMLHCIFPINEIKKGIKKTDIIKIIKNINTVINKINNDLNSDYVYKAIMNNNGMNYTILRNDDETDYYDPDSVTYGHDIGIEMIIYVYFKDKISFNTKKMNIREFKEAKVECDKVIDKIKNDYKFIINDICYIKNSKYIPFFKNRTIGTLEIVFNKKFSKNKKKKDIRLLMEKIINNYFKKGTEKYTFRINMGILFKNEYPYMGEYEKKSDKFDCFICHIDINAYKNN